MRHVFIETNWVVAYAAPAHNKIPAAVELLKKANAGEVQLYLPSICISESRSPIQKNFQPRLEADRVRRFLLWGKGNKVVDAAAEETVRRTLDQMEAVIKKDLERLDEVLNDLRKQKGLEVFDLNQEMCELCSQLSDVKLDLKPFDQMILASVLVRAKELAAKGVDLFAFCEEDSDLQPWDRAGNSKEKLVRLYDDAHIWVYQDFLLEKPTMPEGWPNLKKAETSK